MKTLIEKQYILSEQTPLGQDLPKPKENEPIPTIKQRSNEPPKEDFTYNKNMSEEDNYGKDEGQYQEKQEFDNEDTGDENFDETKDEQEEYEFSERGGDETPPSSIDLSKIYKLRKIYQKLKTLSMLLLKFSDYRIERLRIELNEAIFLFQKLLIPNLDNMVDRLDEIISNYQKLLKDYSIKLQKIYDKRISEKKEKIRRK